MLVSFLLAPFLLLQILLYANLNIQNSSQQQPLVPQPYLAIILCLLAQHVLAAGLSLLFSYLNKNDARKSDSRKNVTGQINKNKCNLKSLTASACRPVKGNFLQVQVGASNLLLKLDYGYQKSEERSAVVHVEHQINQCKTFTLHQKHLVNQFKITGAEMETDKENLWTLIIEIYSAFRKFFEIKIFNNSTKCSYLLTI